MKKYLPYFAIIFAALLWSLDAFLRQALYILSPLLVVTIEHGIGSLIFFPFLKNIEGRSHKEIAEILGISVTAAKVRLHRAHQKLRQILEEVER